MGLDLTEGLHAADWQIQLGIGTVNVPVQQVQETTDTLLGDGWTRMRSLYMKVMHYDDAYVMCRPAGAAGAVDGLEIAEGVSSPGAAAADSTARQITAHPPGNALPLHPQRSQNLLTPLPSLQFSRCTLSGLMPLRPTSP